ncbi:MAG TPA: nucleotide excision repair endonuclease [Candidatus Dormibacteraeota bacterium]|nr:nucleotide excision repair endonuclease [Candidatus Dormibacteraeota bacterium]
MPQLLLFPDPQPLVERLGREFFRSAPECPGVYLMHGGDDAILYVGKAKNLRKRLTHYRVANPERLPRRHLRMLRAVRRIVFRECANESAALSLESELLRSLKPKFNRAGTWPSKPRFLLWRAEGIHLEFAIGEQPGPEWHAFGPMGSMVFMLRFLLVRLFWCLSQPELGLAGMPAGWAHGNLPEVVRINLGDSLSEAVALLNGFFNQEREAFVEWVRARPRCEQHPFELMSFQDALEALPERFPNGAAYTAPYPNPANI